MAATIFTCQCYMKYINSKQKIWKKQYPFCFGNISGDFSTNNMNKTGLNGCLYKFYVDYRAFDTSNIIDTHKYLLKNHDIK